MGSLHGVSTALSEQHLLWRLHALQHGHPFHVHAPITGHYQAALQIGDFGTFARGCMPEPSCPCAGIPFVIINSLCGCLVAYGLAGLRLTVHSLLINLVVTALQSMISIQLQVSFETVTDSCSLSATENGIE